MEQNISALVNDQREFFISGATLGVDFRLQKLKELHGAIKENLPLIHAALKSDLGKSESESYMCETGLALSEITYLIKNLKRFVRPQKAKTPLSQYKSKSYRLPTPHGVTLIISPWNYPFLLAINPLIEAIAAANTVVLKTSSSSPATSAAVKTVIEKVFSPEYVTVISQCDDELLDIKFDYIFYTGSKKTGQLIYEKAAKHRTPVTLELGGKSPCIVDETANISMSAKRIVWGKFLNLGQTCVAPDYVLCSEKIKDKFIAEVKKQIEIQFGDAFFSPHYGKIINERHFDRIVGLIDESKVVCGGRHDKARLKIEPTVLDEVTLNDAIMGQEIFGPVLPIITYRDDKEVADIINSIETPLAFYVFSSDKRKTKKLLNTFPFGGGCVNDVIIHLATHYMPFGGFKESGIGAYHGRFGFDTFSHYKSIVDKNTAIDLPMRYNPSKYDSLIKKFLK